MVKEGWKADRISQRDQSLFRWQSVIHLLITHDIIHLTSAARAFDLLRLTPLILLARLFGRKVILRLFFICEAGSYAFRAALPESLLRQIDLILVDSSDQVATLRKVRCRAKAIRPPVDFSGVQPRQITTVQPRMLVLDQFLSPERISCLLRAYRLAKQKYPRTELCICTSDSLVQTLRSRVQNESLPGIEIFALADKDNISEQFSLADIFVNFSGSASDSISRLIRALAHGIPVLSAGENIQEQIVSDRNYALLFESNDPVALAECIIKLIESPSLAASLSTRGPGIVQTHSWQMSREDWLSLFRGVAALSR